MSSVQLGTTTSGAEVSNVSRHGVWLLVDGREFFLPFEEFPWFRKASIESIMKIERPQPHHLYWPDLDVDLSLDSINHPEEYPLQSRAGV